MATNINLGQSVWNFDDLINAVAIIFCVVISVKRNTTPDFRLWSSDQQCAHVYAIASLSEHRGQYFVYHCSIVLSLL